MVCFYTYSKLGSVLQRAFYGSSGRVSGIKSFKVLISSVFDYLVRLEYRISLKLPKAHCD